MRTIFLRATFAFTLFLSGTTTACAAPPNIASPTPASSAVASRATSSTGNAPSSIAPLTNTKPTTTPKSDAPAANSSTTNTTPQITDTAHASTTTNAANVSATNQKRELPTLQLTPSVLNSLNASGVWIDPTLRSSVDENAIVRAAQSANFPVRVLIARHLPPGVQSVEELAQTIHGQIANPQMTIVATTDDAQMAFFCDDLNDATRRQIALDGAQTWTQEGYAGGVAQTLRLIAYERKLQMRAFLVRVVLPGTIGVLCLLSAFAIWLQRKLKHRARRAISKSLPTTIPLLHDDANAEISVESSSAEAV